MQKKRLLVSYDKLTPELRRALDEQYPYGYADKIQRIDAPNPFYAVYLEFMDAAYLIKVNIKEMFKTSALDDDDDDDNDISEMDNDIIETDGITDDVEDDSSYSDED